MVGHVRGSSGATQAQRPGSPGASRRRRRSASRAGRQRRRPIACLVDLSPAGAVTLHHAARMAGRWRAPLVVLYAAPGPPVLAPRPRKPWTLGPAEAEGVIRELEEFVSVHLAAVPEWTAKPMLGACPAQVAHWARTLRARALIVPARGSAGVGGLGWRGSLVGRLVPLLPCPLVAVPHRTVMATGRTSDGAATPGGTREPDGRGHRWRSRRATGKGRTRKVRDPVCGMLIDAREATGISVHGGRSYLFCAPGCKERFDSRPERFTPVAGAPEG